MTATALAGQVAIVTGAARGIGLATVGRLLLEGCNVVAVDRSEDALADLAPCPRLLTYIADVADEGAVDDYVAATIDRFGAINCFVNNAGILGRRSTLAEMPVAAFDEVIAVNLRGVFLGLRAVLRVMIAQGRGGAIVNTASIGALKTYRNSGAYGTSKHGVVGLTKVAALENAAHSIRVNAICPGPIDTRMLSESYGSGLSAMAEALPFGRTAKPQEVAALIAFLLGDEARYVTGGVYPIDGGVLLGG